MRTSRVVLFGSLGVAVDCLEWLLSRKDCFNVLGVVCSMEPVSEWRRAVKDRNMKDVAKELNVPILSMDDILHLQADIGISIRFHAILKKEHINAFRYGVINLHGAPLPEMRGSMCETMALIENKNEHGVSLHWMDEGIDSGDIIMVKKFPISDKDVVFDIFNRTNQLGLELIKEHLLDIIDGKIKAVPQSDLIEKHKVQPKVYTSKEVLKYKSIPQNIPLHEFYNRVRAFQMPGYEPAYTLTPYGKIYHRV